MLKRWCSCRTVLLFLLLPRGSLLVRKPVEMRRSLLIAIVLSLGCAAVALAYPGATLTSTATTVTVGNLDCATSYEIRVREWRNGAWRDQNTYQQSTLACPTPTPTVTPTATPTASPTPTPTPSGWPDASNTGVPSGTTLTPSGGMTVTTAGAVIDGRDISGQVVVNAPNVTIRNSRIRSTAFRPVQNNSTGLTIQDVEIDGLDANGDCFGNSNATLIRVNMHDCENGLNVSGDVTVTDSWIHDLDSDNGAHTDGAQFNQGATDIVFRHNVIEPVPGTGGATSCIIMWDEGNPQNARVWIENNRLLGQGTAFTVYTPRQSGGTDIYVRGNRMREGVYGYNGGSSAFVTDWSGNVDDVTGTPVPGD